MSTKKIRPCPHCGRPIEEYANPVPTVDIIIAMEGKEDSIILIKRKNPPDGWALPGGFVDYGESLEKAALREAKEETSLDVVLTGQMHTYSSPDRDPRQHTISTVFISLGTGTPRAADDARDIGFFCSEDLPENIAFDHRDIIGDYFRQCKDGKSDKTQRHPRHRCPSL